jgi:LuxR family maltose regulon positive regulatory protein
MLAAGHSEGGMYALLVAESVSPHPAGLALIEPQDRRLLSLIQLQARGAASRLTTSEIAGALFVSANTLKSHMKSIYRKLDVSSRAGAVREGEARGLF